MVQPPKKASANARLRCPVCQHEVLAGDLLQGTNRTWVVIDDPGGEDLFYAYNPAPTLADQSPLRFESEPSSETAENDGEELVLEDSVEHADSTESSKGTTVDWKKFKPISHDEFQRRKRATKPAWMTLAQIVLGGAAAIPVSLLIIWHVLGKDIANAGPMVGQYAPWAVPKKFRQAKEVPEAFWGKPKAVPQLDRPSKLPRPGDLGNRPELGDEDNSIPVQRPKIALDSEDNRQEKSSPDSMSTKEDVSKASNPNKDENKTSELPAQPQSDLAVSLESLVKSQSEWQSYTGDDRNQKRTLAQQFFKSLTKLAENLPTQIPVGSPNKIWKDKAESVCREILKDKSLVSLIDQGSQASLRQSAENVNSLAMFAVVDQAAATGEEFLLAVSPALMQSDQAIPVFLYPPLDREIELGRKSLLLGKFETANAATNIPASESAAPALGQRIFRVTLVVPVPSEE
jgi:hypothetical protein